MANVRLNNFVSVLKAPNMYETISVFIHVITHVLGRMTGVGQNYFKNSCSEFVKKSVVAMPNLNSPTPGGMT